jgi:uroporphyrin-III C-methyltransferase/precorrin-2 dehydrogenase/sirohydrochlorin ferrochelatase
MPAIVDRSPLLVAASTAGASPVLARLTRARLEAALPPRSGELARFAGRHRELVKRRLKKPAARRALWESVLDGEIAELVLSGRRAEAKRALMRALDRPASRLGGVTLIATGDGDTERFSLAAGRALSRADVVVRERGVSDATLALCRREAERVDIARVGSRGASSPRRLAALVLAHARDGHRVCVLRTGDPYRSRIASRDERAVLKRAGIALTVLRPAP